MAMIKCPECGRMISDRASVCIGCGISKEDIRELLAEQSVKNTRKPAEPEYNKKPGDGTGQFCCAICRTEFNIMNNYNCPNCHYPVRTFCGNQLQMKELVQDYRKKTGFGGLTLRVGQYYQMGRYDGEVINWKVLEVESEKALLISEKCLDAKAYHMNIQNVSQERNSFLSWSDQQLLTGAINAGKAFLNNEMGLGLGLKSYYTPPATVTWEECSLRRWLNHQFFDDTFNREEQDKILDTKVYADRNPKYFTYSGKDTMDRIFLLSIPETEKYFNNDEERKAYPTVCAKRNGAYEDINTKCCRWWVRSPGSIGSNAACIDHSGRVNFVGYYISSSNVCIRPALWIKLAI